MPFGTSQYAFEAFMAQHKELDRLQAELKTKIVDCRVMKNAEVDHQREMTMMKQSASEDAHIILDQADDIKNLEERLDALSEGYEVELHQLRTQLDAEHAEEMKKHEEVQRRLRAELAEKQEKYEQVGALQEMSNEFDMLAEESAELAETLKRFKQRHAKDQITIVEAQKARALSYKVGLDLVATNRRNVEQLKVQRVHIAQMQARIDTLENAATQTEAQAEVKVEAEVQEKKVKQGKVVVESGADEHNVEGNITQDDWQDDWQQGDGGEENGLGGELTEISSETVSDDWESDFHDLGFESG